MTAYDPRHACGTVPRRPRPSLAARLTRTARRLARLARPARYPRRDGDILTGPRGEIVIRPADATVPVKPAPGRPPWDTETSSFPALTPERERADYLAGLLDDPRASVTWARADHREISRPWHERPGEVTLTRIRTALIAYDPQAAR